MEFQRGQNGEKKLHFELQKIGHNGILLIPMVKHHRADRPSKKKINNLFASLALQKIIDENEKIFYNLGLFCLIVLPST